MSPKSCRNPPGCSRDVVTTERQMSGSRYGSNRVKWIQWVDKQEDLHSIHFGAELARNQEAGG